MVAVGNLEKVWLDIPEEIETIESLKSAFNQYFNADWDEVMVGAEKPFGYHASYDACFSVKDLKAVTDLTVDQLLQFKGVKRPLNIIAG
ncbi:MAG: hypothetical protein K6U74_09295 [Firmicutes bacterium]|nr:hypothetical protein [Bacillota bacterium]